MPRHLQAGSHENVLRLTRRPWITAALAAASLLLVWIGARSLDWRMVHDPPLLMYQGFLIDRLGLVPYRDFWDNNPPGTQLLHAFIGHTFGYGDRAVRWADLLLLCATLAATFVSLAPFPAHVGWCAAVLWGLVYLGRGPSFQRDDFAILGVGLATAATSSTARWPLWLRAALVGLLFGAAASIKPPILVGLPILLTTLVLENAPQRLGSRFVVGLGCGALGACLPLLAIGFSLWKQDALLPFLEMARGYWPLYTRLSGGLGTIQSPLFNLYSGYRRFGRLQWWLLPATLGVIVALAATPRGSRERRGVWSFLALAAAYLAYVGIQGKFFGYHWHPFLYGLVLLSALALLELPDTLRLLRPVPPLLLLGFLLHHLPFAYSLKEQLAGRPVSAPKNGRPDEIAAFLRAKLRPGDAVQPLDWTGGVVHGMLIAEAPPATPFLVDFPFYHHVSSPYVFELRGRFLEALRKARPRFVIEVPGADKPWVRGKDTTRDFNKLRRFLEANYSEVVNRNGYVIYERRP